MHSSTTITADHYSVGFLFVFIYLLTFSLFYENIFCLHFAFILLTIFSGKKNLKYGAKMVNSPSEKVYVLKLPIFVSHSYALIHFIYKQYFLIVSHFVCIWCTCLSRHPVLSSINLQLPDCIFEESRNANFLYLNDQLQKNWSHILTLLSIEYRLHIWVVFRSF